MHLNWMVKKDVTVPVHLAHHLRASAYLLFHLTMGFALSVPVMRCSAMYCQCMAKAWPQKNRLRLHEATGGDLLALAWSRPDNGTTYARALVEQTHEMRGSCIMLLCRRRQDWLILLRICIDKPCNALR